MMSVLALVPLGGCGADRIVTGSITPEDYRVRHPIVLVDRPVTLDVFPAGAGIDPGTRARLREFAAEYRSMGNGRIEILTPDGSPDSMISRAMLPAIRRALAEGGASGYVSVGSYPADPHIASPVRVSFIALKSKVLGRCGEWPSDLASASTVQGWENRPYWNMGCSYQSAFAAQVADPRDLVEPRASSPGDVEMRIRAIGKVRQGTDPGTTWTIKNSSIGSIGGT